MGKCNSLFQDKQEESMRQQYQAYVADLDEGETPMTLDEWIAEQCYQADYHRITREP